VHVNFKPFGFDSGMAVSGKGEESERFETARGNTKWYAKRGFNMHFTRIGLYLILRS
jgi:hypothetical protein